MRKVFKFYLLFAAVTFSAAAQAPQPTLEQANAALQAGEADNALTLLSSLPASAESHNLRCRVLFTLRNWDQAISECQQAVQLDRQNSDNHLWLGRALGEKADRASFLSAYSLGKQVRTEFEESVRLNPRNADALADLGEFYTEAPGVVGGGTGKAAGVAAQLDKADPARAHELRAHIAESNRDFATAEQELRKAISVSEHPAFQWITLAKFLGHRKRWSEMEEAVQNGFKAAQRDRHSGVALYDGASILSRENRNMALAAKMMEDYLAGSYKTEEAPAFEAHTRLARMKANLGNVPGAWQERTLALQLAHDYRPALELRF